ncbi:hypothetical protein [Streptomyces avidinii]|uniref:Alkaline shock family protein YloU n=1 Tax=Streptomyces avidinii TaxID=1895 RepID=A0ABS4KXR8_STRAV|nr:hypothetical protein [Streptomyces avidinii]MBP2034834.1 hypothetical protein [Streptomyces avidinii]GGY89231.1 hypothetical protein GCM10010343_13060 [Streptomyces avidinii]
MALDDPHPPSGDEPAGLSAVRGEASMYSDAELLAGGELLPCGRPLGHAWQQARGAAGASDEHSSRCPHCREAVEGLTALDRATRALRAEERPDGHSLATRVINAVRSEVRLGTMLLLDDPDHDLRIAESAAAKVLRRAADTVPGIRAASCRVAAAKGAHAVHVVVITVAATLDQPLRGRAEAVRQAVLHSAEHLLGLAVTSVDVEVNAVLGRSRVPGDDRSELSER